MGEKIIKRISDFDFEEQRLIMLDICNAIYMARNISMSQDGILSELAKIDRLFRTVEYQEQYEDDN